MRLTVEQIAMRRRPGLMVWEQDYIDTIDALCAERDAAVTQFAQDAAQEIRTGGVYRLEHPAMPMIRDAIAAERDAARGEALAATQIRDEIIDIMKVYHEQEARGSVDTPGGLEHMGDVWSLFRKWERLALDPSAVKR